MQVSELLGRQSDTTGMAQRPENTAEKKADTWPGEWPGPRLERCPVPFQRDLDNFKEGASKGRSLKRQGCGEGPS